MKTSFNGGSIQGKSNQNEQLIACSRIGGNVVASEGGETEKRSFTDGYICLTDEHISAENYVAVTCESGHFGLEVTPK